MFSRRWLKQFVYSYNKGLPEPSLYFVFLSGGGGIGKSHVIRLKQTDCIKLLRNCRRHDGELFEPNDTCILLTAPTGTTAFNIDGLTLQSALIFYGTFSTKLSADSLNTLQICLRKLVLLIIVEISMVGAEMLLKIDRRLQQIKRTDKPFSGVSILAVGDLYQLDQLPYVQQKVIFAVASNPRLALLRIAWLDHVQLIELTENMRQTDQQFSEILRRVRVGEHTEQDEVLKH